jgi:hypothetical protein
MCLGVPGQLEEVFEEDGLFMGRVRFGVRLTARRRLPPIRQGHPVAVDKGRVPPP